MDASYERCCVLCLCPIECVCDPTPRPAHIERVFAEQPAAFPQNRSVPQRSVSQNYYDLALLLPLVLLLLRYLNRAEGYKHESTAFSS